MRIAQIARSVSRLNGGIFYAQTGLVRHLAQTSAGELRVFGAADGHSPADLPAWRPAAVEALASWPPRSWSFAPRLADALRRFAPDIVHAHGLWSHPPLAGLRWQQRRGRPTILSPHGMLDPGALAFSAGKKALVNALLQDRLLHAATALHALNVAEARAIRAFGLRNPIAIVPNGVELPPTASAASGVSSPRTLLFLGRIHPKKGLEPLIEAWLRFAAPAPWRLVIAGWDDGGHEAALRAAAAPAGARIEFAGPLWGEKKQAAYAGADAFILPSFSEGLPMAVLEAWAHGKPAIITPACNLPDGIAAGAAIETTPSPDGILASLHQLAALSDAARAAMGRRGRALVEERYAWDRVARDMTRLYAALHAGQNVPDDLAFAA